MRERIKVNDLTTIFICPSLEWGTKERRAIADCIYFRDIGGNPILFCLKDSALDKEAQRQDIPCIYYTGTKVNKIIDFRYLRDMRKILKENRFDIIHCYDLDYIWGLCFLLMPNPKVPLLLTFNHYLNFPYKKIWQRWLFRRVDMVITFSQATKEIVQETLPTSLRKIKISGGGVEFGKRMRVLEEQTKKIGSLVNSRSDLSLLLKVLHGVKPLLNSVEDLGIQIQLNILSILPIEQWPEYELLVEMIHKEQLQNTVKISKITSYSEAIKDLDIFLGIAFHEPFNDFEVMAVLSQIPAVLPRTASRQSLLYSYRWIGESYYYEDAREIKNKLLKVLLNEQVYLNELQEHHQSIIDLHGMDSYAERLESLYERIYSKRLRLSKQFQKLNHS